MKQKHAGRIVAAGIVTAGLLIALGLTMFCVEMAQMRDTWGAAIAWAGASLVGLVFTVMFIALTVEAWAQAIGGGE